MAAKMSLLSVISVRSFLHYPALTWCRTLYMRQKIQITEISRACSSFDKPFRDSKVPDDPGSNKRYQNEHTNRFNHRRTNSNSDQPSNKYNFQGNRGYQNQFSGKFEHKQKQKSKFGRKLFKERDISDVDKAAEVEYSEMLNNLPKSERFGTGIGHFQEKTDEKQAQKKNWSDTFGTMPGNEEAWNKEKSSLIENEKYWEELEKEEESGKFYNHIRLARYNRRHVPNWYARRIIKLGKKGQIREAIEVFDKWMIEQDRVKPTAFEFGVLIKLLAEVGYTQKAFQLYHQMRRMKIYCSDQIYSSLFNACANSPWPEDALKWANQLHTAMLVNGASPNYITYLAMIKAYSRNGDINTAFRLADEAIELYCDEHLLSNLLNGCISDKEAGFRHAIVVWRKFSKLGVQPSRISYNLLLRSVKECGIGDPELVNRLLGGDRTRDSKQYKAIEPSRNNRKHLHEHIPDLLEEGKQNQDDEINNKAVRRKLKQNVKSFKDLDKLLEKYQLTEDVDHKYDTSEVDLTIDNSDEAADKEARALQTSKEWWELDVFENSFKAVSLRNSEIEYMGGSEVNLPNILNPNENFSSVIHVEAVTCKEDRLALLGGMYGFLKTLEQENIKPDIVTYTQLAQIVPAHLEDILIDEMWASGTKPDRDFYNLLIRKRAKFDPKGAWELYDRLKLEGNSPDVRTFSCLAFSCRNKENGLKLIEDMMAADIMPNLYTVNSLLIASHRNFEYKKELLRKMQELGIQPNQHFIELVEKQISDAKRTLVEMERNGKHGNTQKQGSEKSTERFRWKLQGFLHFYDTWAQHNIFEEEEHPWKHFMEPKEEELNKK